jgi:hypothetical protein
LRSFTCSELWEGTLAAPLLLIETDLKSLRKTSDERVEKKAAGEAGRFRNLRGEIALCGFFRPLAPLTMIAAVALDAIAIFVRLIAMPLRMRRQIAGRQHLDKLARRR